MKGHQRVLIDEFLPSIEILLSGDATPLNPAKMFPAAISQTWLEIGFGSGENLIKQAVNNPLVGFIGCEPYINGVARTLTIISILGLMNVRIFREDARILLQASLDQIISRTFLLFSDPRPKTRH